MTSSPMKPQLTTAHPKRYTPALKRVGVSVRADASLKAQASYLSLALCTRFYFCWDTARRVMMRHSPEFEAK